MIKKICACITAVVTAAVISVCSFAAPAYNSTVKGSKTISQVECENWLIETSSGKVTHEELNAGYTWAVFENGKYITASSTTSEDFGYQFWYDDSGTFTCDKYSSSGVSRIAGKSSSDSPSGGGSSSGGSSGGTDMSGIIGSVSTGVGGVFGIAKSGFDFILKNALCMFMVSISFAGVALGFVARSFRTSRK